MTYVTTTQASNNKKKLIDRKWRIVWALKRPVNGDNKKRKKLEKFADEHADV